jgi:hypothetical protein
MAYSDKNGVGYRRYADDYEPGDEPVVDETDARLEELYFDSRVGKLTLTVDTQSDGYVDIQIPILPVKAWDNFVSALPTWNK